MQPKFPTTTKDVGDVPEGAVVDIEFPYTDNGQIISSLTPDCGACTTIFDLQDKIIVRFVADKIPSQVYEAGYTKQEFDRGVTIGLTHNGQQTTERLYFSGHIVPANG